MPAAARPHPRRPRTAPRLAGCGIIGGGRGRGPQPPVCGGGTCTGRPMTCNNRWGTARTCGPTSESQGAGANRELGSRNSATKYAELLPEPPEWHLDRALLSAFGSRRCPLLGLLLGMCAPGGCGSRALAGGDTRVQGAASSRGLEPFVGAGLFGLPSQVKLAAPIPPPPSPALQPGSALLRCYHLMESRFFACLGSPHLVRSPCQLGLSVIGVALLPMMWTSIRGKARRKAS